MRYTNMLVNDVATGRIKGGAKVGDTLYRASASDFPPALLASDRSKSYVYPPHCRCEREGLGREKILSGLDILNLRSFYRVYNKALSAKAKLPFQVLVS